MRKFNGVVEQSTPPNSSNVIWLHNGHAKYLYNGVWKAIGESDVDVNILARAVEEVMNHDLGTDIVLTEGTSDNIKELNLAALGEESIIAHAKLNNGLGYGSVYWVPSSGGLMQETNPAGSTTWYNISIDGAISKITESYDIYKYYAEYYSNWNTSKKNNETFITSVINRTQSALGGDVDNRPSNPELGQTYYQTGTGLLVYNGTAWVDVMDNMPVD